MIKKLAVLSLGIGSALCLAFLSLHIPLAAAQIAAYRLTADETQGDKSLIAPEGAQGESSSEPPHHAPPIRFTTVDYQDAGDAGGKVKLAGTAPPSTALYIFFDDNPFAKLGKYFSSELVLFFYLPQLSDAFRIAALREPMP